MGTRFRSRCRCVEYRCLRAHTLALLPCGHRNPGRGHATLASHASPAEEVARGSSHQPCIALTSGAHLRRDRVYRAARGMQPAACHLQSRARCRQGAEEASGAHREAAGCRVPQLPPRAASYQEEVVFSVVKQGVCSADKGGAGDTSQLPASEANRNPWTPLLGSDRLRNIEPRRVKIAGARSLSRTGYVGRARTPGRRVPGPGIPPRGIVGYDVWPVNANFPITRPGASTEPSSVAT